MKFAGTHLIIDLWGAKRLDEPAHIDEVLREAAIATGATILHGHFHHFSPNGGVSGVLVLGFCAWQYWSVSRPDKCE